MKTPIKATKESFQYQLQVYKTLHGDNNIMNINDLEYTFVVDDAPINYIIIPEPFWPHESECCICSEKVYNCKKGIPMYEGIPVPHDWDKEWGGFDACDKCFDDYESGKLETW
jgi:hypothetical protein